MPARRTAVGKTSWTSATDPIRPRWPRAPLQQHDVVVLLAVADLHLQRDRLADEVAQHGQVLAFFFQEQVDHGLRGDDAKLPGIELARLAQDFPQDLIAQRARR